MDGNGRLIIYRGRECFALLGRNSGVSINQLGHHTTHGFDTECQRGYVEQYNVAHTTLFVEDGTLDGRTHGYHFVRVNTL